MNKVKSFVKEFTARVKGDDVTAQAEKALRQADSALNVQISVMVGDTIKFEDAVESAKEELALARVNSGEAISNRDAYVRTLLEAKNEVTEAEENLASHIKTLAFLKETLASLGTEVEA